MPSVLTQAAAEAGDLRAVVGILGTGWRRRWRVRAGLHGPRLVSFTGLHEVQRNTAQLQYLRPAID